MSDSRGAQPAPPQPRADGDVGRGRLRDKVAIVTGGTSGIGAAVARRFAEEGARQVLVALSEGDRAAALLDELGRDAAAFVAGDVTDPATAARAVGAARERFGGLDILVNNAGIDYSGVPILESDLAFSRRVMDVNFFGCLLMLLAAAPVMQAAATRPFAPAGRPAPKGAIINIASRAGVVGVPTMAVYGASKAALLSLTRSAAVELAPHVRVNAVAPGATRGPMMDAWIEQQDDATTFLAGLSASIPQGRMALPEEVADAVLFLASDEASHITGAVLPVDGGYTAG